MKHQNIILGLKILFLLALLLIVDYAVGTVFESLKERGRHKAPNASRTEYTMNKVNAEVLIMGSSRANHHYVPSIISDSLNKTVFNCGLDGQGFSYSVAMLHAVLNRYTPEIIIVDIAPSMLDSNFSFGKLYELYPYYSKDVFYKNMIEQEDSNNRYKMQSKMFMYNSRLISLMRRNFLADYKQENGYAALPSSGYKFPSISKVVYESNNSIDADEVELLLYSIKACKEKGVNLVFSVSPRFQESNVTETNSYIHLKEIVESSNIPFIYMGDNTVINDSTMYKDNAHLNHNGAVAFTETFVGRLKRELINYE